jgi:hypothetical protein
MSTLTSNGLSEADQREAAWSNFCRETPVHLRGPWEAFVWAWEARKHSNETFDDLLCRIHRELAHGHTSSAFLVVAAALEHRPIPDCAACDVVTLAQNHTAPTQKASG